MEIPMNVIILGRDDYDKLKQENYDAHRRIFELTASNQTLQDTLKTRDEIIISRDKTIEELRRENAELKEIIMRLEEENRVQKTKINELNENIDTINEKINKLEHKQLFKKYMIGIQDLNRLEKLETKITDPEELVNIRLDRIGDCHYIDENYSNTEQKCRINVLIDKINNMPDYISKMFEAEYSNVIEQIKPLLTKYVLVENQKMNKRAHNWWNI